MIYSQTFKQYKKYIPIIKNFLAYSLGSVVQRSITAITSLLALRIISPSKFGLLSLINQFMFLLPIFLNLGLRQAFWLEYFHIKSAERRTLINYIILIYLIIAVPLLFFSFLNVKTINRYFFLNQASYAIIIAAISYSFIQFFSELYLQVLRNQMNAIRLTIIQLTAALLTITLNVILVFYYCIGIIGIVLSNLAGITLIALIGFYHYFQCNTHCYIIRKNLTKQAKYLLILGFPFIPNILFSWILSSGDRWILAYITDMKTVGIYALADMVGQIFNMCILYPMNATYIPYMLNQYAKHTDKINEIEKQNRKNMWYAMVTTFILITIGTLVASILGPYILPPKYLESLNYIWFILIGYVFFMGTYFSSCILVFKKRIWLLLGINTIAASTNIILNLILIPSFKIYGCVTATMISYIIFFYLNLNASKKANECY